jgi:hypothetical protein
MSRPYRTPLGSPWKPSESSANRSVACSLLPSAPPHGGGLAASGRKPLELSGVESRRFSRRGGPTPRDRSGAPAGRPPGHGALPPHGAPGAPPVRRQEEGRPRDGVARRRSNLLARVPDFGGFDPGGTLASAGGVLTSRGNFLEILSPSQRVVVGRLGAARRPADIGQRSVHACVACAQTGRLRCGPDGAAGTQESGPADIETQAEGHASVCVWVFPAASKDSTYYMRLPDSGNTHDLRKLFCCSTGFVSASKYLRVRVRVCLCM